MNNEIILHGDVGGAFTAASVAAQLEGKGDVIVRVHSLGGSIIEGIAIANILKNHNGRKDFIIEGIAASMMTYIVAYAADSVRMAANGRYMIHRPALDGEGLRNADELRRDAAILDSFEADLVAAYRARTSASEETLSRWLDETTWFTATEAVAAGFVDSIFQPMRAVARVDLSVFQNAPAWEPAKLEEKPDMNLTTKAGFKPKEGDLLIVGSDGFCAKFEGNADEFAARFPDVSAAHQAAVEDAAQQAKATARDEFTSHAKQLHEAFPGDPATAFSALLAGQTVEQAKAAACDAMTAKVRELEAKLKEQSEMAPPAPGFKASAEPPKSADDFEARIEQAWEANAEGCQDEFSCKDTFAAFERARHKGLIGRM